MTELNKNTANYYEDDFKNTKSTHIEFCEFLAKNNLFKPNTLVCDMACGSGSGTVYYAKQNPNTSFLGVDYNREVLGWGKQYLSNLNIENLNIEYGDWYNMNKDYINKFDGIFSIHSFCTLKKMEQALDALFDLNPKWIALNSLFYDGPCDVLIHIRDYTRPEITDDYPDADFNIFSLERMKNYCSENGYIDFKFQKFIIPFDIQRPENKGRGTYTVKTEFDDRAQFSGPVYLPWYFVIAKK